METIKNIASSVASKVRGDSPTRKEESEKKEQLQGEEREQWQRDKRESSPAKRTASPTKRGVSPTTRRAESPSKRSDSPTKRGISPPSRRFPLDPNIPPVGQNVSGGYEHFEFRNLNKDPTVNLFNRVFNRETHTLLGRSGVKVSRIALGTMNFGKLDESFGESAGQLDENKAHEILDKFVELGGNCIDTANFFPWFGSTCGESEKIIGNWLAKRDDRERLVIITKMRLPTDPSNVAGIGLSRTNVIQYVENSLRRLQTNYIDYLQIDGWDYTVHVKEIVRILDELLMSGKVRNIGLCDFKGWQVQRMIDTSKYLNKHSFTCFEGEYSLLSRGCEMEVVDVCLNHDLGFIAYSPFKYGFLASPAEYQQQQQQTTTTTPLATQAGAQFEESASSSASHYSAMNEPFEIMRNNPCYRSLYNTIQNISNTHNISMPQIALRWVLQKNFVSTVVVGVDSVQELEDCMRVLTDFKLTEEEMIQLDQASLPYLPYPYLSIPTDIGRKLYMNAPGPIVYSQLSYLTQAITLNDRKFDFGYSREPFQQVLTPTYGMKHERDIQTSNILLQQQQQPRLVRQDIVRQATVPIEQQTTFHQVYSPLHPFVQTPLQSTVLEGKEPAKEQYQKIVTHEHKEHRESSPPRS